MEIRSAKPGVCSKCGMALVHESKDSKGSYAPLIVIVTLIFITSIAISYPFFNFKSIVMSFMAGFFLIFSGFKLVDLKGFADGYKTYDVLAMRLPVYGYIYPFIELLFGLAMIMGMYEKQILLAEAIVMTFSGIGVAIKLLKKEKFQCVCLGTFLKIPLTKITLIEDFSMVLLALTMYLV